MKLYFTCWFIWLGNRSLNLEKYLAPSHISLQWMPRLFLGITAAGTWN